MNTLFVYCAGDEIIKSLCRESSFKRKDTHIIEVDGFSAKSPFKRLLETKKDKQNRYFSNNIACVDGFDRIILACDEIAGEIPPGIAEFIKGTDFRYKTVDCVIFGNGKFASRAGDSLKIKVSLSGGTVRCCFCISPKEIKKEEEDILFSLRHRLAV